MREFTKSLLSYSLALSLFGLKQMQNLLTAADRDERRGPATKSFDALTNAATDQLGETTYSAFRVLDNVQRGLVALAFSFFNPFPDRKRPADAQAGQSRRGVEWSSEPAECQTPDSLQQQPLYVVKAK